MVLFSYMVASRAALTGLLSAPRVASSNPTDTRPITLLFERGRHGRRSYGYGHPWALKRSGMVAITGREESILEGLDVGVAHIVFFIGGPGDGARGTSKRVIHGGP
ncbi:hypothetical protein F4859DRAFT_510141 [Xylaria cf. heliscus]|nr:hypothetical protein F4859DRAFT_510141 [Xylaria cf. heliscus]